MRSSLVLLAGLAGSALAYPTDMAVERRTFGLLAEILGGVSDLTVDVTSILGAVLGGGHHSHSSSLLAGLGAEGAAALQGGALGCKAGVIHAEARAALKVWLHLHANLEASLKTSLISWCEGDDELVLSADVLAALAVYIPSCADIAAKGQLYVTIDGIFGASSLESALVLSASLQSSLSAWIEAAVGLDVDVKAGLNACAAGGVVTSLTADVKASLLAWINGSNCDLSAELKVSVLAWINGHHGHGLVEIGALGEAALSTISVGASVGVHVEESGILSVGGQASLAAFLGADVSADLSADVQLALEACAKGKLATAVDLDIRTKLAIWLSGSDCSLGVELKAVVLFWLSFGVDASVSVDLVSGVLSDVTGLLTELLSSLSVDLRAALSVILSGGSLESISLSARAELAAFLGGCTGLEIDVNIQLIIIEWFTGCSIPGAPSGIKSSSVPSLPSSTPYVSSTGVPSAPGASVSVSIPSGPAPSGSSPSGGASGSAPSGVSPTGSVPSGPGASVSVSVPAGPAPSGSSPSGPETTPCDTLTGVDVSSTVIPGGSSPSGSVPSGPAPSGSSPSGPAPSGSVPGGPAPSGSSPSGPETTPCETLTGVDVSSTVIPGMPAPSGGASGPAPSGPAPTDGASGPSPSGVSPTGTPVAPGAGESTTPCDTLTSEEISSTVIPGMPAPSGGASGPAPSNSDVSPTGTPVPSGPAASGPSGTPVAPGAGETTTPCDTLTSGEISSTVIPGMPVPSGGASGPAPSNSDVSPTGTAVVPSGPAATGGSWTESWAYTQTKETTISATVPCETGSGSVPTITAPAVASSVTTVTATVTATVCGCDE
ncbi:hypothetical protein N7499_005048 [Penicillium canescens]|uniref:Cell wall protein n=1 Tax=Penicillium canescens TaxID=5083 RepID=A0AAD6I299_PENCN|nr:uncharacterized protein N7446_004454 [Penicillium canescens]KAJ6026944.1 hypothetical protein N7460_011761 [Penicillium canescens]KAJ6040228.1 hypothetical protein N7444_009133 [Penicillium canescens]KAJ6067417.1 hypothetical protein N7446_004454 [Penicillium canescens]KAJ6085419.1 hypothetical protein N7499_005048 [Penicillium canescens]KAJ6162198.1 hypothetical protein N7485_010428 [Penicillium canescens]